MTIKRQKKRITKVNYVSKCKRNIKIYLNNCNFLEDHFDLDLKEAIEAPPLSLSTPDLHDMTEHNSFQPLRRSASSSELLYEKVFAR